MKKSVKLKLSEVVICIALSAINLIVLLYQIYTEKDLVYALKYFMVVSNTWIAVRLLMFAWDSRKEKA